MFAGTASGDSVAGSTGASVWSGPTRASCGHTAPTVATTSSVARPPPTTRQRRTKEPCGRAALEGAELVREADEDEIDRRHAAAQVVWRDRLLQRDPDDDAHVVEDACELACSCTALHGLDLTDGDLGDGLNCPERIAGLPVVDIGMFE